jgi:hypothetical protein
MLATAPCAPLWLGPVAAGPVVALASGRLPLPRSALATRLACLAAVYQASGRPLVLGLALGAFLPQGLPVVWLEMPPPWPP